MKDEFAKIFENRLLDIYESAQKSFGAVLELPSLSFERLGSKAGLAYYRRNHIIINPDYFANNLRDMLYNTLPHEAAHLISYKLYGENGTGHGRRWKSVMVRLGLAPERCHGYDTSVAVLRRTVKYTYKCPSCLKLYKVGRAIHNRQSSGEKRYFCKSCKVGIVYCGESVRA